MCNPFKQQMSALIAGCMHTHYKQHVELKLWKVLSNSGQPSSPFVSTFVFPTTNPLIPLKKYNISFIIHLLQ